MAGVSALNTVNAMEVLKDIYNLRYNLRCASEEHEYASNCCARTNDIVGVCYHAGMATAFDTVVSDLSALLDKAESGR